MIEIFREHRAVASTVTVGMVISAVLTGCTSSKAKHESRTYPPSVRPAEPTQSCTAVMPGKWESVPTNFSSQAIAEKLNVRPVDVAQAGRFGGAVCSQAVSIAQIQSLDNPPIVSISGEGAPCLVMGSKEDPRTVTATKQVLAVCANPAN